MNARWMWSLPSPVRRKASVSYTHLDVYKRQVCDKIVQDTEPYRKENLPMIRYGTIGTNFIVDRFQEAAKMCIRDRLYQPDTFSKCT